LVSLEDIVTGATGFDSITQLVGIDLIKQITGKVINLFGNDVKVAA